MQYSELLKVVSVTFAAYGLKNIFDKYSKKDEKIEVALENLFSEVAYISVAGVSAEDIISKIKLQISDRRKYSQTSIKKASSVSVQMVAKRRSSNNTASVIILFSLMLYWWISGESVNSAEGIAFGAISAGFMLATIIDDVVVSYRIRNGLYGNNEYEVREIIEFMISKGSGFDGGDGRRISIFGDNEIKEERFNPVGGEVNAG